MKSSSPHSHTLLTSYFAVCFLILLGINSSPMDFASAYQLGWKETAFALNAWLSYNLMYLAPALLLTWLAGRLSRTGSSSQLGVAVVTGGLTSLFFYASARLHELYGMFVNGFVINLIVTPGGIESLGGSDASNLGFALIALGFVAGHAVLMAALYFVWGKLSTLRLPLVLSGKFILLAFLVSTMADRATYAYADAFGKSDLMVLTDGIPHYLGFTSRTFLRKLGFKPISQHKGVSFKGKLRYPTHPLQFQRPEKQLNIVWLVSESWRADTLDAEIMPRTWEFAAQAQNFKLHYSAGNGTRIGVFGMMTGVPGSYWEPFLKGRRSAPLIDVLQEQGYQMSLYSSAKFSYPEFDQTIFSKIPRQQLHEAETGTGWQNDRKNVGDMLDFIEKRDPTKPFFTWMFFESPHARYYFPPESVIRKPYRDDINYATMDRGELRKDIVRIKNRYINSVHHLDSQFARVTDYLKSRDLLENTVVVMVGDHGEEFMENGFWGHNSTFSDAQTRTPLVIWIPGKPATIHTKLTSHLDIPATLLPLLGVSNPPRDYSVGYDLLSSFERENVILSDWSHVGYIDIAVKITLPMNAQGGVGKKIAGPRDEMLSSGDAKILFAAEQPHLVEMMREMGSFTSK